LPQRAFATVQEKEAQVEIELMTYPEIYAAIRADGKTTVLVVNGGIEQRGPHAVLIGENGRTLLLGLESGDGCAQLSSSDGSPPWQHA
jgi:hypothetical protein